MLFCACVEYLKKKKWVADTLYFEAEDLATAKAHATLKTAKMIGRIVAVGPVIGYHVKDAHGEKLEA